MGFCFKGSVKKSGGMQQHTPITPLESPKENDLVKDLIDDCNYILLKKQGKLRNNPNEFLNILHRVRNILDE